MDLLSVPVIPEISGRFGLKSTVFFRVWFFPPEDFRPFGAATNFSPFTVESEKQVQISDCCLKLAF